MKIKLFKGLIKLNIYKMFSSNIKIGKKSRALTDLELYAEKESSIVIKDFFYARKNITVRAIDGGKVVIGNNVFFNDGVNITCMERITIGDNTRIGHNVLIYDHDHAYEGEDLIDNQGMKKASVEIEDNVWIGSGVIILRGTKIGSGSVIAAGTVVKEDIPKKSLVYMDRKLIVKKIK